MKQTIELNIKQATEEIKQLLENEKINIKMNGFHAGIFFNDIEIIKLNKSYDNKLKFNIYYIDITDDKFTLYADIFETLSKIMRLKNKIDNILLYYMDKIENIIHNN